ncbi:hypothetical protein [Marinagarivorans cellulosilyticus]|uniref:Uncharacterized protein n=1 Tax=Marinagarivorans cellulosilyticus TaxID=2721545 RepID=A0AAN1WF85_9GAMM|nr:hypothetical protein [Marinagarivorans cellulosilyticus]BCD96491.1 hypothetical protein MARGE09_P0691 [Marinagarivorans cellulosilyticus]
MFKASRRRLVGAAMVGAGTVMSGCGLQKAGNQSLHKGRVLLGQVPDLPKGLIDAVNFPLIDAIGSSPL